MDLKSVSQNFEIIKRDANKLLVINKAYREIGLEIIDNLASLKERSEITLISGRGRHWLININKGGLERIVVRRYRRGGLINRWFWSDWFYGLNRPLNELNLTESARRQNAPVPEILAVIADNVFGPFWQAEIIFKEIPNTNNLFEVIQALGRNAENIKKQNTEKKQIISAVAEAVKKLHQAGVWHGDLQVRNILIQRSPDGVRGYTIDLDKARLFQTISFDRKVNNLVRFYRSIEKWGAGQGIISPVDRLRFLKEYFGEEGFTKPKRWLINHRCELNLRFHRFWWSLMFHR